MVRFLQVLIKIPTTITTYGFSTAKLAKSNCDLCTVSRDLCRPDPGAIPALYSAHFEPSRALFSTTPSFKSDTLQRIPPNTPPLLKTAKFQSRPIFTYLMQSPKMTYQITHASSYILGTRCRIITTNYGTLKHTSNTEFIIAALCKQLHELFPQLDREALTYIRHSSKLTFPGKCFVI